MKNKIVLFFVSLMLVVGLVIASCAPAAPPPEEEVAPTPTAPVPAKPRVLKAISGMPIDHISRAIHHVYADEVARRSNGLLTIDMIGSTETIGLFEQAPALKEGIVDIGMNDGEDIGMLCPSALAMLSTDMKPWEQRERGIWDFYREVMARDVNAYYLGCLQAPMWWVITSRIPIGSLEEIKGVKVRAMETLLPGLEAIGAVPVSMPFPDIYTAMERGVMDAFVFPPVGWTQFGWQAVTYYIIGPRLMEGTNSTLLINLDVWNSLSKQEQNWLTQPIIDNEEVWYGYNYYLWVGPEYGEEAMVNAGLEHILWSDEDNRLARKRISDGVLERALEKMSPEDGARWLELIGQ